MVIKEQRAKAWQCPAFPSWASVSPRLRGGRGVAGLTRKQKSLSSPPEAPLSSHLPEVNADTHLCSQLLSLAEPDQPGLAEPQATVGLCSLPTQWFPRATPQGRWEEGRSCTITSGSCSQIITSLESREEGSTSFLEGDSQSPPGTPSPVLRQETRIQASAGIIKQSWGKELARV